MDGLFNHKQCYKRMVEYDKLWLTINEHGSLWLEMINNKWISMNMLTMIDKLVDHGFPWMVMVVMVDYGNHA